MCLCITCCSAYLVDYFIFVDNVSQKEGPPLTCYMANHANIAVRCKPTGQNCLNCNAEGQSEIAKTLKLQAVSKEGVWTAVG